MIRFIVDAQLPPALARWLSERGYPAEHVFDFAGDGTTDAQIWEQAMRTAAVILSKDEDFALRAIRETPAPPIVWIRVGNTRRATLIEWFGALLPSVIKALERANESSRYPESQPMRILHVFDHSLPLHSGYTFRSANILREQRKLGWETFHLTSPKQIDCTVEEEEADGLRFFRTPQPNGLASRLPGLNQQALMRATEARLMPLAQRLKPDLPHDILYRRKMGFSIPLAEWFRGPLRDKLRASLLSERMGEQHARGAWDYSAALWSLLMFAAFLVPDERRT